MPQVRQYLACIVRHQSSQNAYGPILDIKVGILHAVEKHKEVLISTNEWIELRVKVLKHCAPNPIVIVRSRCHKELV
jgi:hypothetical protein